MSDTKISEKPIPRSATTQFSLQAQQTTDSDGGKLQTAGGKIAINFAGSDYYDEHTASLSAGVAGNTDLKPDPRTLRGSIGYELAFFNTNKNAGIAAGAEAIGVYNRDTDNLDKNLDAKLSLIGNFGRKLQLSGSGVGGYVDHPSTSRKETQYGFETTGRYNLNRTLSFSGGFQRMFGWNTKQTTNTVTAEMNIITQK